jgi:DNA-binding Lrp family transcriptional regulator
MPTWSFLTNTGAVLLLIAHRRQITAREIAERLALTERPVRRIIADLEAAGYLHKQRVGRLNYYEVNLAMPLPQPVAHAVAVGDVLPVFPLAPTAS